MPDDVKVLKARVKQLERLLESRNRLHDATCFAKRPAAPLSDRHWIVLNDMRRMSNPPAPWVSIAAVRMWIDILERIA